LVVFETDSERIRDLAEKTLELAFISEISKIHSLFEDMPTEALHEIFNFYVCYVQRAKLEDKLASGLACTHAGGRQHKGERRNHSLSANIDA
jgi:hypothetical protein